MAVSNPVTLIPLESALITLRYAGTQPLLSAVDSRILGALSHATAIRSVDMRARIKMKILDFFIVAPIIIPFIANRIREAL